MSLLSLILSFLLLFLFAFSAKDSFFLVFPDGESFPLEEGATQEVFLPLGEATFPTLYENSEKALSLSAEHAALLTLDGKLLYGKNEGVKTGMASTTKIMTAYLAALHLEKVGLDVVTTVSENAAGIEGSSVYLKVGEEVRLIDLLYATLLASANDGAAALAEAISGDIPTFVALMNETAKELGLVLTHFENPHGLAEEEHYTTAYELGILAACAMENELFRQVASTKNYTFKSDDMTRSLSNHNRMLTAYEGAIGVKTGFTKATGRCLVTAAERDGVTLLAVTLNAPNDWQDHTEMLDYGFAALEKVTLFEKGDLTVTIPVVGGTEEAVKVTNGEDLFSVLPKERGEVSYRVELPYFAYASIAEGEVLGRCVFMENGKEVASCPLVAKETVEALSYKKSLVEKLRDILDLP